MGFLNLSFSLLLAISAQAQVSEKLRTESDLVTVPMRLVNERNLRWVGKSHPEHCDSVVEYKAVIQFLRTQKEIYPSEGKSREIAAEVSKGCLGAAERFAKTLLLLVRSGVDHTKATNIAITFSKADEETAKNFYEIFQKVYLGEFYDLDYQTAIQISYELSRDYDGNKEKAREDFLKITKFCFDKQEMNLNSRLCAEISLKFARLSRYYPEGVYSPFENMYRTLREDKRFGLDLKSALSVMTEVLPYGPKAPGNFIAGFDFAISPEGLNVSGKEAISIGVLLAKRSVQHMPPPVYDPIKK